MVSFIDKVAVGRSIKPADVRAIAQGRVWSGLSAQGLDLVDEMGGLNAAIDEALHLGHLTTLSIEQVPGPSSLGDTIALMLEESGAAPIAKVSSPLSHIATEVNALTNQVRGLNDPRSVYTRMPYGLEGL